MSATPYMTTLIGLIQEQQEVFAILDRTFSGTYPVADHVLFDECKRLDCVLFGTASALDIASAWKARRAMQAALVESTKAA